LTAQALARLETQLLGQHAPRLFVHAQRVRLSSGAIEREHQLAAQALPERVLRNETLQLGRDCIVAAERQIGVDPHLQGAELELFQPPDLDLGEGLVAEVGQRRSPPQSERLPQRRIRVIGVVARERAPSLLQETLEAIYVHLTGRDLEDVTVRARVDDVFSRLAYPRSCFECLAQARDMHLNVLDRARGRPLTPQGVDQPIDRDDLVRVQEQHRQDKALLAPSKLDLGAVVVVDLERSE